MSSCAARAALDSAGIKKAKIYETSYAAWKVAYDEAQARAAASGERKEEAKEEPPKAPEAPTAPAQ